MAEGAQPGPRPRRGGLLVAVAVTVLASVVVVLALVLTDVLGRDRAEPGTPREVSVAELRDLADEAGGTLYWAGSTPGRRIELTSLEDGSVFVRYLAAGAPVGDRRPAFTTVGTYPFDGAYREVERRGRREGMTTRPAPGGGLATWSERSPTSVYLAYPGSDVLVEVYDPDPRRARSLVLSGEVGPVR